MADSLRDKHRRHWRPQFTHARCCLHTCVHPKPKKTPTGLHTNMQTLPLPQVPAWTCRHTQSLQARRMCTLLASDRRCTHAPVHACTPGRGGLVLLPCGPREGRHRVREGLERGGVVMAHQDKEGQWGGRAEGGGVVVREAVALPVQGALGAEVIGRRARAQLFWPGAGTRRLVPEGVRKAVVLQGLPVQ